MTGTAAALILLKVSLLLGAALLAAYALRRAPAVRRHRVWSAAFVALVALPPLALTLPVLHVPVPAWGVTEVSAVMAPAREAIVSDALAGSAERGTARMDQSPVNVAPSHTATAIRPPSLQMIVVGVWLVGAVAALIALCVSLVRVTRLTVSGREVHDAAWRDACSRIATHFGLERRVRVLSSSSVITPMAGGVVHPTVFVPESACGWSDELREIVLAHEIAHLASRDPLRHLVSRAAFTLYWFHPLVWLAARQAADACEQACDDAVLALGVRPSTYARVLLEFAAGAPLGGASLALPIVKRALLEERLMAILDNSPRPSTRRRTLLPALGAAVLTLSVAAATPSARVPSASTTSPSTPVVLAGRASAVVPGVAAVRRSPAVAQAVQSRATACWRDRGDARSFEGSLSMTDRGGETIISEQVGRRGNDRVVQKSFGDLRVCALAEGIPGESMDRPSEWAGRTPRLVLETQQPNDVRRMEIVGDRVTWTVNGTGRVVDAAAAAWRDGLLSVLDVTWDLSRLRGQVSSLRGQISSIHGERSSLHGEISMLRGQVSVMNGDISVLRGTESVLRGEISTISGQLSSLRGEISSERGAISTLQAARWDRGPAERDRIADRIRQHEEAIGKVEDEIRRYDATSRIREVEGRIAALDTDRKIDAIEQRIREFDLEGRVAAVNRRIGDLGVERHVEGIESDIAALDVDRRARALEARRDEALGRLRNLLGR